MSAKRDSGILARLSAIAGKGIQVDRTRLKKTICTQFPDWRLWIREYIANAYDAQARTCRIYGRDEGDKIVIGVADNGCGMDRNGVEVFLSKFRSLKTAERHAVGRFGIGSFSAAAIPSQCGYHMTTSTGEETWRMSTGCLLEDKPIQVESITPVLPRGTLFELTFSSSKGGAADELRRLQTIAKKYVYHLPINVRFESPGASDGSSSFSEWAPGNWFSAPDERCSKRFCFALGKRAYDVVFGVGPTRHQLYQHRVLITENREGYDLIRQGEPDTTFRLPHLSIRVESPDFELPIGRHCLCNDTVLKPLARYLRDSVLPAYLCDLAEIYAKMECGQHGLMPAQLEDLFTGWLAISTEETGPIYHARIFRTHDGGRLSMAQLVEAVNTKGKLYIEDPLASGMDYDIFDAPVLTQSQPEYGLELIQQLFKTCIVSLSQKDLVQEAPAAAQLKLTADDRRLEKMLGFHPEVLSTYRGPTGSDRKPGSDTLDNVAPQIRKRICAESMRAARDLEDLHWRVGYLVGRDGKTPCRTALYLNQGSRVLLNLHHPDIRDLVALSTKVPDLAGHFAMALCIGADNQHSVLPHLSQEARDQLIQMDVVCRCSDFRIPAETPVDAPPVSPTEHDQQAFFDFLRNTQDEDFSA